MKKILVIEDEKAVRDSILDILDAEGFYAAGAENGQVGVELASQLQPNLILCDVMMPELDGYGVLRQLRLNPQTETIPFIFLTAKVERSDIRQGMTLGADDYLPKPFTHAELLQAITTRLNKQEAIVSQSEQRLDDLRQSISFALPRALTSPLGVITHLSSDLIEEYNTATPAEILEMAEMIHSNANLLHQLMHNFLLYAKLEVIATNPDQVKALQNYRIDYSETVIADEAIQKSEEYGRREDLELSLKSVSARISENKLKKIVEELVDNAFRFSTQGSLVKVYSFESDDKFVLHVIDYGRGMTAEQISHVGAYMQFDPELFDQQGTGLGLAIAKRLTELHGGEMLIESILGKQTIVRISLPR
ncbi:hybrid sensor histidine kinase/response regulator [Leptolyngbya sp. 'hensonii']|uniref:hybrid sensor histidine kinase/response regulator n=1 Tax=Leptolyngbya sp. 'hensonii' TaxID=1922337 RepID=UPI00094F49D8|nr:response regulator [Leptolyngbya sp. 'hensonii']OLP19999.1 hybrid sensor histidine kinase/response regulator [Leptolyngbya sp. 'hensonii']